MLCKRKQMALFYRNREQMENGRIPSGTGILIGAPRMGVPSSAVAILLPILLDR
jgi:hypothetical protein